MTIIAFELGMASAIYLVARNSSLADHYRNNLNAVLALYRFYEYRGENAEIDLGQIEQLRLGIAQLSDQELECQLKLLSSPALLGIIQRIA